MSPERIAFPHRSSTSIEGSLSARLQNGSGAQAPQRTLPDGSDSRPDDTKTTADTRQAADARSPSDADAVGPTPISPEWDDAIATRSVTLQQVVRAARWSQGGDARKKALGDAYYHRLVASIKAENPQQTQVAVFASIGAGVVLFPDGELATVVSQAALAYDWSAGRRLLLEIDVLAQQVPRWVSEPDERRALSVRLHGLTTVLLGASSKENDRAQTHVATGGPLRLLLEHLKKTLGYRPARPHAEGESESRPASETFTSDVAEIGAEVARAARDFEIASQRSAQVTYARGMLWGGVAMAVLSTIAGVLLAEGHASPADFVAVPAAALGAVVSVLQRMSTGSFSVDVQSAGKMIKIFGAVRPFIGAIFGGLLYGLIKSSLVDAFDVPTDTGAAIAFFAVLGFVAGFNERFVQDMLTGIGGSASAKRGKSADARTGAKAAART